MDADAVRGVLNQVDALRRDRRIEEALRIVDEHLAVAPQQGELHLRRGLLVQLLEAGGTVEAAQESLGVAAAMSPSSIEAKLELGHLLYAVRDRPLEALPWFTAARERADGELKAALVGEFKCHLELGNLAEAEAILDQAVRRFPEDREIEMLREEIEV